MYELCNISRCKAKENEINAKGRGVFLLLCLKQKPQFLGLDFFRCLPVQSETL